MTPSASETRPLTVPERHVQDSDLRSHFEGLVQEWKSSTRFSSSSHEICMHPTYQQIIGLGERVLPLIFEEIDLGHRHWHWALCAITGENPAASTDSLRDASEAWLDWGEERGLFLRSTD